MKWRLSFVANSSSISFVIKRNFDEDPEINIKDCLRIPMNNYIVKDDNDNPIDHSEYDIKLNWVPSSVKEVYDATMSYLKHVYLCSFFSINCEDKEEYISKHTQFYIRRKSNYTVDTVIKNKIREYYDNEYEVYIDKYNLSAKMLYDFKINYIDKNLDRLLREIDDYNGNITEFMNDSTYYNQINEYSSLDTNILGFQKIQMLKYYDEFCDIYRKHPISAETYEVLSYCDIVKDMPQLCVMFMSQYSVAIIMFLYYLACMHCNQCLTEMSIGYSGEQESDVDPIVHEIYNKTGFKKNTNFELVKCTVY